MRQGSAQLCELKSFPHGFNPRRGGGVILDLLVGMPQRKALGEQGVFRVHDYESYPDTDIEGARIVGVPVDELVAKGRYRQAGAVLRTRFGQPPPGVLDTTAAPPIDQRGFHRPLDGNRDGSTICDIGAVEVGLPVYLPLVRR